jgi:hypothetical protein
VGPRLDPLTTAAGWYDLTVTIDGDGCWSQRHSGHLETGQPSVTGEAPPSDVSPMAPWPVALLSMWRGGPSR